MNADINDRHPDVTGWQGPESYFRFIECEELQPSSIVDVLRGRHLGVIFRNVVPAITREEMVSRFFASPGRQRRGAEAPGEYLGTYHYGKTIDEYLDQTATIGSELEKALDIPSEPLRQIHQLLREKLALDGIEFRLARHRGREACVGVLRSWHGQRQFALDPHEDLGQCEDPKQAGFEIQRVAAYRVVALNICLDNGPGGRLAVWNLCPDEATRTRLGVRYTGSPYAVEWLTGIHQLWLDVRPGDIYLFNAAHVHAVEPVHDANANRVTLSGMMGFSDARTVIAWT
jgi:hypothetical protein